MWNALQRCQQKTAYFYRVKRSVDHLPLRKQQQILQVVNIIKELLPVQKIILFGSHATGTWVEDKYVEDGVLYEYRSDYDFLIVTEGNTEKEYIVTDKIVNRSKNLFHTAVNVIVHDIHYINEGLEVGQYFFSDIVKEGVLLHDTGNTAFAEPKELTPAEQREIAEDYFKEWFHSAKQFLIAGEIFAQREENKIAAFQLHQAAERFYNSTLLVFTGYKPKTHSLEKLRQYVRFCSKKVFDIFPEAPDDKRNEHLFDLLRRGYIDARYKRDYAITDDELKELTGLLQKMSGIVEKECLLKIDSLSLTA